MKGIPKSAWDSISVSHNSPTAKAISETEEQDLAQLMAKAARKCRSFWMKRKRRMVCNALILYSVAYGTRQLVLARVVKAEHHKFVSVKD